MKVVVILDQNLIISVKGPFASDTEVADYLDREGYVRDEDDDERNFYIRDIGNGDEGIVVCPLEAP